MQRTLYGGTLMKSLLATAMLVAFSAAPVMAQTISNQTGSQSQAGSYSGVNIQQGNGYRQAPSAITPGLIAGGLSCSGSGSLGGSGAGWGLSLGITKEDRYCNAREDAKYIQGVTGSVAAAKERLCDTPEIRRAFARAGQPCAVDGGSRQVVAQRRTVRRGQVITQTSSAGYAVSSAGISRAARIKQIQDNR